MASLVTETGRLSHKLRLVKEEAEDNATLFRQYRSKMVVHQEAAKKVEQGLPVQQELEDLQFKIAELKERS